MSADRETSDHGGTGKGGGMSGHGTSDHGMSDQGVRNDDMTTSDISLLLADAADEVEIGIAPYAAVLRGGRRRKARRWAVASATALVLVGSAGTLAVAGMPGGDGGRGSSVATGLPPTEPAPDVRTPSRTLLGVGTDRGNEWRVYVDVWDAPRDLREAEAERAAMSEFGQIPSQVREPSELVGRSTYFVTSEYGDAGSERVLVEDAFTDEDSLSGKDVEAGAFPLSTGLVGPERLVVGRVDVTAERVTCTWKDGSTTQVPVVSAVPDYNSDDFVIRPADGSPVNWFVCVAPQGTAYKSVAVTK
ncbi:hypothetical protein [Streptomyces sp. NPDC093568]|uniref:hypothetical protein n=1 Tax=Streptomyces sp. NPDC093568 TaxID=3366041 RepID=UPI0038179DC1